MSAYKKLCYDVVCEYTAKFGAPLEEHQHSLFNITGEFRNRYYSEYKKKLLHFRIFIVLLSTIVAALSNSALVFWVFMFANIVTIPHKNNYTARIVNINGHEVAVVIPTQQEEGYLEARNFEETKDVERLYKGLKLNEKKNLVVISVGSTSSQVIYGQEHMTKTEFDMGVDNRNNLDLVLDSVKRNVDYVCFMNAIGYGIRVDAGIVVSDNVSCHVAENVVPRTVGGTGNNVAAMTLVHQLAELHKRIGYQFKIAFVPRGDPAMPQGGSHSKQRLVDAIRSSNGLPVTVIEISGKQTKKFYIDAKDNDWELDRCSTEELCKLIKETKVVDENGKTYGSGHIFA